MDLPYKAGTLDSGTVDSMETWQLIIEIVCF